MTSCEDVNPLALFQGGVWLPHDGVVNPTDVAMALSKRAREMGENSFLRIKLQSGSK